MSLPQIIVIVRALAIWPFTAIIFAGLVFAGYVHGPWNGCWFFAMGCWFVLDTFWVLAAQTTKPIVPARQYRRAALTSAVVHLLYCLPLSSVPVLGLQILPRSILPEAAGAALCVVGVGFAIWSRYVLAGNWNAAVPLQQRHQLVRSGPYAIVRHPIYLGFFLVVCGMILALGEVRALVCAIHATQFFHKMKLEENILRETYPGEYPEYERKVKRLLPCIW